MDYHWLFTESKPGSWIWRCVDRSTGSVIRVATREFPLLYACVEDAKQHGFIPAPTTQAQAPVDDLESQSQVR